MSDQLRDLRGAKCSRMIWTDLVKLVGRERFQPRSAQRGVALDHHLVAGHCDQRRVAGGFGGHIGHGPHAARIQIGQCVGQRYAVGQRAAGAFDPQADENSPRRRAAGSR